MTKNEKLIMWYAALGFPPICATCPNMAAYEKQNEGATVIDCRAIGGGGRYLIEKNVYPEVWCEEREKLTGGQASRETKLLEMMKRGRND